MISTSSLLAFVPVSVLVVAVPGPSVLFAIGQALSVGRRGALLAVVGNGAGLAVQAAAIALGVGAVLASMSHALVALKLAGGCYLGWLGVQAIRHRHGPLLPAAAEAPRRSAADLRAGFVVGVTNPKTLVLLTALLPQFVPSTASPTPQMLLLGAIFAVVAIVGDTVWALGASAARHWFARSPRRIDGVRAGGGVVLVGLGAYAVATAATRHTGP